MYSVDKSEMRLPEERREVMCTRRHKYMYKYKHRKIGHNIHDHMYRFRLINHLLLTQREVKIMPFVKVKLEDIHDNPFRNPESYVYDLAKIDALAESIGDTSFWENLLGMKDADGTIYLAYGHHRLMALKKLVDEGMTEYAEIRLNVRPHTQLTRERMLKIFAQENKDDWGENPQNLCMTVLQLQAHLEGLIKASKDKDAFIKKIGDVGSLLVDDRSFTRMKNHGVGASIIAQFLGNTWSRQTIQDALQVIENDEKTFKLAQKLPSVTLANRFQKLVTKEVAGKGKDRTVTMFDEVVQQKIADKIVKEKLTRSEVEDAVKISKDNPEGPDPLAAIANVVEKKKNKAKVEKENQTGQRLPEKEPVEKIQVLMEKVLDKVRKERINLKEEDIVALKVGLDLIREVLDNEPEEIANPLVEEGILE